MFDEKDCGIRSLRIPLFTTLTTFFSFSYKIYNGKKTFESLGLRQIPRFLRLKVAHGGIHSEVNSFVHYAYDFFFVFLQNIQRKKTMKIAGLTTNSALFKVFRCSRRNSLRSEFLCSLRLRIFFCSLTQNTYRKKP